MKLTAKQERFVEEYLVDLNATQAALRAKYSKKTAAFIGAENLKKPKIKAEIERRMALRGQKTGITQEKVVNELAAIGMSDITDYVVIDAVEQDGKSIPLLTVKSLDELTPLQRSAIASIKQTASGIEVKLWDKNKALELLGRHLGMYTDKIDVKGTVDIASVLSAARGRVKNRGEPEDE